MLYSKIKIR